MNPVAFSQSNAKFGPPTGLAESQCLTISAWQGTIQGGSVDGVPAVVVCWKPDDRELDLLKQGHPIFLTFLGGLPPHYPSLSFPEATNPA